MAEVTPNDGFGPTRLRLEANKDRRLDVLTVLTLLE